MPVRTIVFFIVAGLCFTSCDAVKNIFSKKSNAAGTATITREGLINCFEKNLSADGKPVWCEASAILFDGKKLFVANDKDMPGNISSVFTMPFLNGFFDGFQPSSYSNNILLRKGKKYEDFALTPDGKYVFLTTAFDRVQPANNTWDGYNTVAYWKTGDEANPQILSVNGKDSSSVSYRALISAALKSTAFPSGPPYFKIEGLAATGDMLYWGVREEGKKYDSFTYKIKILTCPYFITGGKITTGDFKLLTDIPVASFNPASHPMALSSIEYDHFNKRFLLLTSYEEKDAMGGYLWSATAEELQAGKINIVKDSQGKPLEFHNKCEDLAIINQTRLIIIHDDDRMKLTVEGQVREPHQAAYSVVEFRR